MCRERGQNPRAGVGVAGDHDLRARREYAAGRNERVAKRIARDRAAALRRQTAADSLARYAARSWRSTLPLRRDDATETVLRLAPRLAAEPYALAVHRLLASGPLRTDWTPRGRGRDTVFRSLAEHQLARYPAPALLWSAFFDPFVPALVPLVTHVAAGGSLHEYVSATAFPVPLTRRMCHDLLTVPFRGSLLYAIRRVEVRAAGGDDRLFQAWMKTRAAQELGSRQDEVFWLGVLGWLARSPELDPAKVGPLVDYIAHRRRESTTFSVSGRSLAAVLRGLETWHKDLAAAKVAHVDTFPASGFDPIEIDLSRPTSKQIWRVTELRSSKDLAAEGRRMSHCVLSYARLCATGQASIWSMTCEDGRGETGVWAMVTIEVHNQQRRVAQVRGRYNRSPTGAEVSIVTRWAGANRLTFTL